MTYCPSFHERGTDNKHYLLNSYLESHAVRSSSCACLWFSRPPHLHAPMYPMHSTASRPLLLLPPLGMLFLPWECSVHVAHSLLFFNVTSSQRPSLTPLLTIAPSPSFSIPLPCFIFLYRPICVCLLGVCFSPLEFKLLSTKISVCFIHCGPSSTQKNA